MQNSGCWGDEGQVSKVINLTDLKVDSLSRETLELVSALTAKILSVSGKGFSFDDPLLLLNIRRRVKRLKDPELTTLYREFQAELLRSVKNGHFEIRSPGITASERKRFR